LILTWSQTGQLPVGSTSGAAVAGTGARVVNAKAATIAATLNFFIVPPKEIFVSSCYSSVFAGAFGKTAPKTGTWL
jgi:hypothetical protein